MLYSATKDQSWAPYLGDDDITLFAFDGKTLPTKFVQPYLNWRRTCEATSPGECFTEPAITCFPPKLHRELICSPFYPVMLDYYRTPDSWCTATIIRILTRHALRVLTFADAVVSARETVHVTLPGQVELPRPDGPHPGAVVIATRAWNHIHLLMHCGESTPMAKAAERYGIFVPAHPPWTREALAAWSRGA